MKLIRTLLALSAVALAAVSTSAHAAPDPTAATVTCVTPSGVQYVAAACNAGDARAR